MSVTQIPATGLAGKYRPYVTVEDDEDYGRIITDDMIALARKGIAQMVTKFDEGDADEEVQIPTFLPYLGDNGDERHLRLDDDPPAAVLERALEFTAIQYAAVMGELFDLLDRGVGLTLLLRQMKKEEA